MLLVALGASVFISRQGSSQEFSAEELSAILQEQLTSIESIRCEYTFSVDPPTASSQRRRQTHARQGKQWHYSERIGDSDTQQISCFDGDRVYSFNVVGDGTKAAQYSLVGLQDPRTLTTVTPECLYSWLQNPDTYIADLLRHSQAQLLTPSSGHPRLMLNGVSGRSNSRVDYDVTLELDPTHEYLPQQILMTESPGTITWPGWEARWTVHEFRRIVDGGTKGMRWFPVVGMLTQGSTGAPRLKLTVDQVRLNAELPVTLFRPDFPDGVVFSDSTSTGHGRLALKGDSRSISEQIAELSEPRRGLAPMRIILIVVNVVVVLFVLILLAWRKRWFRVST
jgi:outer membrane lipoprotein-sorting protein